LQRVLLRIADVALGTRISVIVEAENVGQAATVPGNADHRGERARPGLRQQQVADRAEVRTRVEDELLAGVAAEVTRLEHLGVQWGTRGGKAAESLDETRPRL